MYLLAPDDYIVGNNSSNIIVPLLETIKYFQGMERIQLFVGSGQIPLIFPKKSTQDKMIIDSASNDTETDTVFGFGQGNLGDIIELKNFAVDGLKFLPLIDLKAVPVGKIANSIVRIFGNNLSDIENLEGHFSSDGLLENLELYEKETALLLTAKTKNTGENQNLYSLNGQQDTIEVFHIATFAGNYLDIDSWSESNFIV